MMSPQITILYIFRFSIRQANTLIAIKRQVRRSLADTTTLLTYGSGIGRLDYVVSTAEAKGVKIVMPLLNNYGDLGGIPAYTTAFGGNSTSFYTDAESQAAYRNYVQFIVNRYKNSPAIFAWELANEPRCSQCPSSVITNWATSISAYIKSLDSKHMVALGDEGWFDTASIGDGSYAYSGYEGVDFVKNLAIPTLDYGTFHCYPDQWGYVPLIKTERVLADYCEATIILGQMSGSNSTMPLVRQLGNPSCSRSTDPRTQPITPS